MYTDLEVGQLLGVLKHLLQSKNHKKHTHTWQRSVCIQHVHTYTISVAVLVNDCTTY